MSKMKVYFDGWMALPAAVRNKLGLGTGDFLDIKLVDGTVVLTPAHKATTTAPTDLPLAIPDSAPVMPARRGPGRPRKVVVEVPLPASEAKPARGRPRKIIETPAPADAAPRGEPWKLVKKADLQVAAVSGEPVLRPGRQAVRFHSDTIVEERRPFRHVEVRKLGPGRGHGKRPLSAAPTVR